MKALQRTAHFTHIAEKSMGQAKQNRERIEREEKLLASMPLDQIADAVRKLCTSASANYGRDCVMHAYLAQSIMERLGAKPEIVVGEAAWRVGEGDCDVIAHTLKSQPLESNPAALPYHAWLSFAGKYLDFTTYQFADKAAEMDRLDGGKTTVLWCPPYLCVSRKSVFSYRDVAQLHAGMFYYEPSEKLREKVMQDLTPSLDDAHAAWIIFSNPGITVIGPDGKRCD